MEVTAITGLIIAISGLLTAIAAHIRQSNASKTPPAK